MKIPFVDQVLALIELGTKLPGVDDAEIEETLTDNVTATSDPSSPDHSEHGGWLWGLARWRAHRGREDDDG